MMLYLYYIYILIPYSQTYDILPAGLGTYELRPVVLPLAGKDLLSVNYSNPPLLFTQPMDTACIYCMLHLDYLVACSKKTALDRTDGRAST